MTHLETYPFVARDQRTLLHRVLGALALLATLAYAGLAGALAVSTYAEGASAAPGEDTSLYGLGYLVAGFAGGAALVCALVGVVGWKVARRSPDLGAVVLLGAVLLGFFPVGSFVI